MFHANASSKRGGIAAVCLLTVGVTVTSAQAQVLSVAKDFTGEAITARAIDDAGSVVYAVSSSNQFGTNPQHIDQIFRWDPVSGTGAQITNFAAGVLGISVSDDGQWLVFRSSGDLTGANHDQSVEVFVMHPDGTGLTQLTSDTSLSGDGAGSAIISGSGNRIVFNSDADPLGTNPGRAYRTFVVDRDGTNLVQLAEASVAAAISDDGTRLAYRSYEPYGTEIRTSPADGSTAPVTIATASQYGVGLAFSGDGGTIVFQYNDDLGKVNWDGSGLISPLAPGYAASITDNGQTIFYRSSSGDVRKIAANGSADTLVAAAATQFGFQSPIVSGDGSRIVLSISQGEFAGVVNPDGGPELLAMDGAGGSLRQLTQMSLPSTYPGYPRILPNGSRIFFWSSSNPLGENADGSYEVFTMLPSGAGLAQVTHTTGNGVRSYSVSDAGLVVFETEEFLTGQNCGVIQFYKINFNGTGLTQVTSNCANNDYTRFPVVRFDGQQIVFLGIINFVYGLYRIPITGGAPALIATSHDQEIFEYRMSTIPIPYVVSDSPGNNDGHNPNYRFQIARMTTGGAAYLRITADPVYDSFYPDISGDGNKIVWESQADFVGQNPDHSYEVFLYDVPTATMRQLSNEPSFAQYPRITRDGAWVYYQTEGESVRVSVATNERQRVLGILKESTSGYPAYVDVDATGARTLITGRNTLDAHTAGTTLFIADQNVKPKLTVGKAAPTVLNWDPDPQSIRYDVIRGDVASLSIVGSTVNLGAVTCLEDDSPDNQTIGYEDAAQPAPGQAFFYLYRGTVGLPAVTGSFGQGTGAKERVAAAGSCGS